MMSDALARGDAGVEGFHFVIPGFTDLSPLDRILAPQTPQLGRDIRRWPHFPA